MKSIYIITLFFIIAFTQAKETCQSCHQMIETSCDLRCEACHISPNANDVPQIENGMHARVILNPSDERWWDEKCVSCHKKQIETFKNSFHYSAANIIGQTRFLFGKNERPVCDSEEWKTLKDENKAIGHSIADLADNLLSKKCLACHFAAPAVEDAFGKKRNSGCAACHIPLNQKNGKALFGHKMQKRVGDTICLTCHNSNHVGADYYGYFEQDYHNDYRMPYGAKPVFGAYQHRLSPDVHQQRGMHCVDCHRIDQSKGHGFEKITCEFCHEGFKVSPSTSAMRFDDKITAHHNFHKKVSCSACHAQWSYQDYGLHLFLDESNQYEMWENTPLQGDYQISRLLNRVLSMSEKERPYAESANRLSGKISSGVWYKSWTFRRWEEPPLGIDEKGKYTIIRPLYQYYITYVDKDENVWLDSQIPRKNDGSKGWAWDNYSPHTIGKIGRNCESCHGNTKAAGLGIRQSQSDSVSNKITLPNAPIGASAHLLNKRERNKLLHKSPLYKKWRAIEFKRSGIDSLFN